MTENASFEKQNVGDISPPTGVDGEHFAEAWELAVNFEAVGRRKEAVDYFLLAAALLEKSGRYPEEIYTKILSLDGDNALAASRLKGDGQSESRRKVFVNHVLARHKLSNTRSVLADERQRQWVTPPRDDQHTCTECGMGVPEGRTSCAMCGALTGASYKKRTTAAYGLMGVSVTKSADETAPEVRSPPPSEGQTAAPAAANPKTSAPRMDSGPQAAAPPPPSSPTPAKGSPFIKEADPVYTQPPPAALGPEAAGEPNSPAPPTAAHSDEPEGKKRPTPTYPGGFGPHRGPQSAPTAEPPREKRPRVSLLQCDGSEGVLATSEKKEVLVGTHPECFGRKEQNSHAEEKHARIAWTGEYFLVTDLDSRAGVYLKVASAYTCAAPRLVQIGSQTLLVSRRTGDRPGFRVGHLGTDGREMCVVETPDDPVTLGRADSALSFPQDPYLSAPHAQIQHTQEGLVISDLSSQWGTYVKLPKESSLEPGAVVRVGRLLLRLEAV